MATKSLKLIWFAAFAVVFLTFIAYSTALPVFGDQAEKAWQWLLPNLLPPLGILFGIEALAKPAGSQAPVKPAAAAAGWALPVSLLYLLVLAISVVGVLFTAEPIAFLNRSNYWLAPLLAFTTPVLGAHALSTTK